MQWSGPLLFLDTPVKHAIMIGSCLFLFLPLVCKSKLKQEYKPIIQAGLGLYIISLLFQIYAGTFKLYALKEFYFLIAPLLFSIALYTYVHDDLKKIKKIIDIIFYIAMFSYGIELFSHATLSMSNFIAMFNLQTLFVDSISPLDTESDTSITFFLFFCFYSFINDKKKWTALFLAFLGFKRLVVFSLFSCFFLFRFLPKSCRTNRYLILSAIIFFCVLPTIIYLLCTDQFADWFYMQYGIDFDAFTMSRFQIINAVIDANLANYGLGTVTDYLLQRDVAGQLNMHNDILRIQMETTVIGTILFTYQYFSITTKNIYSFIVMLFMFIEMFAAHVLGPGTMLFWILVYMTIIYYNIQGEKLISKRTY